MFVAYSPLSTLARKKSQKIGGARFLEDIGGKFNEPSMSYDFP
jgi:hypothetical protein